MDYHKIIDKNWVWFEDLFGSREDLKSHSLALKNYRNPLSHVRDMDQIDQKRGEASVLWFRKTLAASVDSAAVLNDEQETVRKLLEVADIKIPSFNEMDSIRAYPPDGIRPKNLNSEESDQDATKK
jgi:hypothetical protein